MITTGSTSGYEAPTDLYNRCVRADFTIGDVVRKSRTERRWSQTKLGTEAARFPIGDRAAAINKSTVSKIEREPYTSELGNVWRLLAALNLTFADVERLIGAPFTEKKAIRRAGTG